ncbi:MAG: homoserine dehydrogenase [Candidatus Omnitrophica bacterium]|nr:homoserine dehydrogenase [Candidatus Omnitrophota bacterium]
MKTLRIGLLGLGQIGGGLYKLLRSKKEQYKRELGISLELAKVADIDRKKQRELKIPKSVFTTDAWDVVRDPSLDVIVELIGGTKIARELVKESMKYGKDVVTANKALLAEYGDEIFELAHEMNRWILFEASVGGGIPVIKALREGLVANRIDSILSIINGTSNYILSKMTETGADFEEALKEAQQKGYAESDPTLDIDGSDAAHKLAILARFAFGGRVKFSHIYCEGISKIRSEDILFAKELGYRIKLLAIAKAMHGGIEARVQPTLLPESHILANVNGSFNAILMRGDEVGDVLFYGRGAGSGPTASAVFSNLIDIALREGSRFGDRTMMMRGIRGNLKIKNISSILSRYYLRFYVVDKPGVLARISQVLGKHRISISDVIQKERSEGNVVPLYLLTHDAHENDVRKAIHAIDRLRIIRGKSQLIRIENN